MAPFLRTRELGVLVLLSFSAVRRSEPSLFANVSPSRNAGRPLLLQRPTLLRTDSHKTNSAHRSDVTHTSSLQGGLAKAVLHGSVPVVDHCCSPVMTPIAAGRSFPNCSVRCRTKSAARTTAELAIPTDAYENAYADMRPSIPVTSFGPADGSPIKLLLPSFSLSQGSDGSRAKVARTTQLSDDKTQRASLSERTLLAGDALASVDPSKAKALAAARLASKHGALERAMQAERQSSDEGPSEHGAAARLVYSSQHSQPHLDKQIKSSSSWLAQAVMVLAILAGGAICGGIGAVFYCWKTRDLTHGDQAAKDRMREGAQGKNFGRPAAQYGSYGAKRGR